MGKIAKTDSSITIVGKCHIFLYKKYLNTLNSFEKLCMRCE